MSSAPGPADIAADATWLAQALDPASRLVRMVRMTAEHYRAAAFLDDRMLAAPHSAHVLPWGDVAAGVDGNVRADARWIFHIGHVGSTLIARLLGELPGVLSVREPRLLRDLTTVATADRPAMAAVARRLYSRTFGGSDAALIKATSFVSEMAPELVAPDGHALFIYASPRAYIEGILAGENSVKELRLLAATRRQRMAARVGPFAPPLPSDADLAAEAWACEMTALEAADRTIGEGHVLWADFDRMLEDMGAALATAAGFLELPATPDQIARIAAGPLMSRYSKATEYEYSPALRRELLAEARHAHGKAIDTATGRLEAAAESAPLLRRAIKRSAG